MTTTRGSGADAGEVPRHLVLVGLMGSGKSSVGRLLAERLGRPLVDSDEQVEATTGCTVREIFATQGEAAFRSFEAAALRDALGSEVPSVIAAAGGVVLDARNRAALRAPDVRVVWLRDDVEVLLARVASADHRPLLDTDPEGTLRTMATEREELYREVADRIVTVEGRTVAEVAEAVLR